MKKRSRQQQGFPKRAAYESAWSSRITRGSEEHTTMKTYPISRRSFLRGVGVSVALPWLESLSVWGDENPKERSSEPPVRFACLFSGNGYHSKEWWAKGEGA